MTTAPETGTGHPRWRRNQIAISIAVFIGFASFTLVMPFLPLYFAELGVKDAGAIAIWSGISLGVTPAITAAVAPFWARIAETYGRKMMVVRALLSFVVVMALMAMVRQPWHVVALRALLGLFAGYGTVAMTMAAESSPPEHMGAAIGWVQTAQRLGPALGPIVGGVLAETVGLRQTFVVAAFCYFGAFALVVFGYDEQKRPPAHEVVGAAALTFRALGRIQYFTLFVWLVFTLQLVDRSIGPIVPLYLAAAGRGARSIPLASGLIFTTAAAAAAVGNQCTTWVLARRRPAGVVAVSAVAAAAGALVFGFMPPLWLLLCGASILGFGLGLATTTVYTAAGHAVGPVLRGVAFGYLTTAYLLGLAVSPIVAGFIGAASTRAVFIVDAVGLVAIGATAASRMAAARKARAQGTGHRAQGTGHRAQGKGGRGAWLLKS